MAENIYKATIEAKTFDCMVKHMKKVLSRSNPYIPNKLIECIHLDFQPGRVKCIAIDGHRIHEEYLPAQVDHSFSCHIDPPSLSSSRVGHVTISLEDGVAYVEFGNVRFSTKQSKTPLTVFGSEKIQELIGDDERFEVAVNPQYLLDAINAVKSEKRIILNVGDPLRPITIRPDSGINQQMCGILPIRKHDSLLDSEESVRAEQRQKLKAIQRHLESLLATVRPAEGSSESAFWSKAVSFKADLDAYFTMQEEHSKEDQ